jgi:hypothetical protein
MPEWVACVRLPQTQAAGTSTSLGVTWVALSGMSCLVPQRFAQFTPLIVGFIQ